MHAISISFLRAVACTLSLFLSTHASAAQQDDLIGKWCFYEQEGNQQKLPEKVDIALNADRTYVWQEGAFQQKGTWSVSDARLELSGIGKHDIVKVDQTGMELRRMTIMRLRKEKCSEKAFADQDIIQFQNAASTGDLAVIQQFLERGIDPNIPDFMRGDTALIKSAKFCQVKAAELLLAKGGNKAIKNEEGKVALDYAVTSSFHKGCEALVKQLR
jgi:hypothetical protein